MRDDARRTLRARPRRLRRERRQAAARAGEGRVGEWIADARRPPLRRAGRRTDRRRRRSRPDRSRRRRREVRLQAVRDARRDGGRARGHRPVHAPALHDDASLSQREVHPEHLQVQRRPDFADPGVAALSGEPAARREDEVRLSADARGRRRRVRLPRPSAASSGRPCAPSPGSTGTTRASSGRDSRSNRRLRHCRRRATGYRRRSSACCSSWSRSRSSQSRCSTWCAATGRAGCRRKTEGRRCRRSSARSPSSSGRVDGLPSTSGARRSRRSPTSSIPRTTRRHVALEPRGGLRRLRQRTR